MTAAERIITQPWAIVPMAVPALLAHVVRLTRAEVGAQPMSADTLAHFINQRPAMEVDGAGVATINVVGPVARGLTPFEKRIGQTDYNDVMAELAAAAADPSVRGILLAIDSPGGAVVGCADTSQAVLAATAAKPVVAYSPGMCCSAAFSIACGADAIITSPSAMTGSIGTIATFADYSAMLLEMGLKVELITAKESDLKSTWSPLAPMTKDQRADAQRQLDSMNAGFLSWVQDRRPAAKADSMRGQWFSGSEAQGLGLVDATGQLADARAALASLVAFRGR